MQRKRISQLLLGAHMSISGGLEKSLERGALIDCSTIQLFTKSNRQWEAKELTQKEIDLFRQTATSSSISPIVAHASYLINIGSPKEHASEQSTKALADELERCNLLGIDYLVVHPGSHVGTDEQSCLDRIIKNINSILSEYTGKTKLLFEIMAGQGSTVCYTFEHLAYLLNNISHKKNIGVCFDTCHAFAAGYDFRTSTNYEAMWKKFDATIGLHNLYIIHVNDSKKDCGSRVDRHEDIGKGKIGLNAFKLLFNDKRFFDIAKILETPKENLDDDTKNMEILKNLITPATKKLLHKGKKKLSK